MASILAPRHLLFTSYGLGKFRFPFLGRDPCPQRLDGNEPSASLCEGFQATRIDFFVDRRPRQIRQAARFLDTYSECLDVSKLDISHDETLQPKKLSDTFWLGVSIMAGAALSLRVGAVPSGAELAATIQRAPMWHPAGHPRVSVMVR